MGGLGASALLGGRGGLGDHSRTVFPQSFRPAKQSTSLVSLGTDCRSQCVHHTHLTCQVLKNTRPHQIPEELNQTSITAPTPEIPKAEVHERHRKCSTHWGCTLSFCACASSCARYELRVRSACRERFSSRSSSSRKSSCSSSRSPPPASEAEGKLLSQHGEKTEFSHQRSDATRGSHTHTHTHTHTQGAPALARQTWGSLARGYLCSRGTKSCAHSGCTLLCSWAASRALAQHSCGAKSLESTAL